MDPCVAPSALASLGNMLVPASRPGLRAVGPFYEGLSCWLLPRPPYGGQTQSRTLRVRILYVCRACATARKWKSSPNLMEVKGSGAQERQCKTVFERSAEQTREGMNKNRI